MPHPAESKMHFRIQAKENSKSRAVDILRRGLEDLHKVCDHSIFVFDSALEDYRDQNQLSEEMKNLTN